MSDFLPKEVMEGLREAHLRNLARKSRIRVQVGDDVFPVLKMWRDGFAMDIDNAPHLRGLVDLYDGTRHVSQCLIVASSEDDGIMNYEFKRNAATSKSAALDFVADEHRPVALLDGPST